jgi:Phage integrase, N-terminal SAM-like domain
MIEDMAIRKFAPKTQHDYVQRVKDFAAFLGRSPDTAKSEEVRAFRLHLMSSGAGTPKINVTVSALRRDPSSHSVLAGAATSSHPVAVERCSLTPKWP